MTTMLPKQLSHSERLQGLQSELVEVEEAAKSTAQTIKELENDPGQKNGKNLFMFRKILQRELKLIRLYRAEIAKHKRTRPSV